MCEIKFRGRGAYQRSVWYVGDLVRCDDGRITIRKDEANEFYVDPETVGQFTGHYDVMGHDIYEGDIVTGYLEEDEWPAVVEWDEVSARFVLNGQNSVISFDEMGELEVTIIGNVHDNPNLLEVAHD